ncbi:MAG: tetratricopeptide repeat protein [Bryobacteraceae bacterium]
MSGGNTSLLFRLYTRPVFAMSAILDQASLFYACILMLIGSAILKYVLSASAARAGAGFFEFYSPLLITALFYVPGTILAGTLIGQLGAFRTVFDREYASFLTCTAMAWSAAYLPVSALLLALRPSLTATLSFLAVATLYFAFLMVTAVRTVFGIDTMPAAGVVALSAIPLAGGLFLYQQFGFVLRWLASPFILYFGYVYFSGEFRGLSDGFRGRQSFRRYLDTCTVNPHDAEAQYQLGLIYQHRRQNAEAIARFRNAVQIDPRETDAHFQLGRIAREQGRLKDALSHFQTVIDQNPRHASHEILREIGGMYNTAREWEHARGELAAYIEYRPYDPEGLYLLGQALENLNRRDEAREMYSRSVEAARTAPRFRRRFTDRWGRLSQKQLGKL